MTSNAAPPWPDIRRLGLFDTIIGASLAAGGAIVVSCRGFIGEVVARLTPIVADLGFVAGLVGGWLILAGFVGITYGAIYLSRGGWGSSRDGATSDPR